jgi:prolyl-tRNA editing enzyme YbaK/EbsC (Cys-tRNA(Pro) deacylase)
MMTIEDGRTAIGEESGTGSVPGRPVATRAATMAFAVADDRPVALIFPAGRRVVPDRLHKLLGADHVRLATGDETARFLGDLAAGAPGAIPAVPGIRPLIDASLLSARALHVQPGGAGACIRLPPEEWLATADPAVGFFSEPEGRSGV